MDPTFFDNLSPPMKQRLDKWRKNPLPVKSAEIFREKSPGNFVPRKKDYGDDLNEFIERFRGLK